MADDMNSTPTGDEGTEGLPEDLKRLLARAETQNEDGETVGYDPDAVEDDEEEEDGELMLDLILPEQVEQYTFDESTVLDQIYIPDGELALLDVMVGKRGKSAYIFVIFQEEYTPSLSSYAAFGSYTLTLMVCKQDGKWYLNYTTSFFH